MRQRRPPAAVWYQQIRPAIWVRDGGRCTGPYCRDTPLWSLPLDQAQIDHIRPLSCGGTNADANLRVLCERCHVLRADRVHRGLIRRALQRGIIPPDWRRLVWHD